MDQTEVASALSWLGWLELIKRVGGFMVIAGVAIEVGGDWISGPFHKKVEDARQLELTTLNNETAQLSKEAETARKETAQAQLQLQQLRFPRGLDADKLRDGIKELPPQFFEVLYDPSAADANSLAFGIFVALHMVSWKTDQKLPAPLVPRQGPIELRDVYPLLPLTQQAGGQAWGLSVVTKGPIDDDAKTPENALIRALLDAVSGPIQIVSHGKDESMPAGKIRIIVGPKLP
ncbi:hypothetical protein XH98_35215 [Bradyrhizobium sp. CCBAU 51745]|uniref:hypothetical protein n=1 Tax=Bradyrhizobium sp. CCBAU 51745 TaxID=1325099 RepID=UPI00230506C0|nr:hypothetical protein [Bradyrhizobium sp. CCBAU 51745]MDA9444255.1 hypothetical protein [Bradyrhizobium sp. CCBAU 51745]